MLVIMRSLVMAEVEREVDQLAFIPEHDAQVQPWRDLADLVAYPVRHQRRLRVVEHNALFLIEPARTLVDLRDDGLKTYGQDFVAQFALFGIKNFALPRDDMRKLRGNLRELGPRIDNRGARALA